MTRTDNALHISEMVTAYGFQPGGTFHIEAGQRENQFIVAATHGRLRPLLTEWHVVYTEPGSGREFTCAAFGREELATEVVEILTGRLTSPNLGGYCATARIPLVSDRLAVDGQAGEPRADRVVLGPLGGYYHDLDGHSWASTDLGGRKERCALCGRLTPGGYSAAMTDVLVCDGCVVHVDAGVNGPACAHCGAPIEPTAGRGRPRRYCGKPACEAAARRRRRQGLPEDAPRVQPGGQRPLAVRLQLEALGTGAVRSHEAPPWSSAR